MDAIRTKDKIFVALVVPLVLAGAYFYFIRSNLSQRIQALSNECATLVDTEDFPMERQRAERTLAQAKAEKEAELKIPMSATKVKADAHDSAAAREMAVLALLRQSGLTVRDASSRTESAPSESKGCAVLRATGARPNPICRTYTLAGGYPNLLSALHAFASREMAVIPESVTMSSPGHWSMTLWL